MQELEGLANADTADTKKMEKDASIIDIVQDMRSFVREFVP